MLKSVSIEKAPVLGFHHDPMVPVLSFIELKFSSICGVSVPRVIFPLFLFIIIYSFLLGPV